MIQINFMKIKKNKIKSFSNSTGKLIPFTFDKKFPIKNKRIFFLFGKKGKVRGEHAHKKCSQYLFLLSGSAEINAINKHQKRRIIINSKKREGFLIKPKTWLKIKFLKKNSILMVICDMKYNFSDYIEDFKEFKKIIGLK